MIWDKIVAIYVMVDDTLKALGHTSDAEALLTLQQIYNIIRKRNTI